MASSSLIVGLIGAATLAIAALLIWVLLDLHRLQRTAGRSSSDGLLLQAQLDGLREQVRSSLEGGRLELDQRLQHTNRIIGDLQRGIGEVDRQMRHVGAAASELRGLQELLRAPKVRGEMGEVLLAELLAQVLPRPHYELQYEFDGQERVDAVLRAGPALVPVDAKFPMDNFQRLRTAQRERNEDEERSAGRRFHADVRRHVEAIAKRYIRPDQGTYDFAMMYIPAEGVYRELIEPAASGADLLQYALSRRVVPVSPQSFYAYLQVILLGLRGLTIESEAREILNRLGGVRDRLDRFAESFDTAARHVGNAQRQMEEAARRLSRLDSSVSGLTESSEQSTATPQNRNEAATVVARPPSSIRPSPAKSRPSVASDHE